MEVQIIISSLSDMFDDFFFFPLWSELLATKNKELKFVVVKTPPIFFVSILLDSQFWLTYCNLKYPFSSVDKPEEKQ